MGETEEETGSCSDGGAMPSKSLIQFSVDGWGCLPSLLLTWGKTMVEVMKIMPTSFKRSHGSYCYTQCPQPCSKPPPTHASTGDSWTLPGKSGSVSCGVTASFSWVLVSTRFCLCPSRVYFSVLCKFWQLFGGINGDLLQEGLCHTHVCCTQSPCPCSSPLLTRTSRGDAQTQFCLSLCGVSGSWFTRFVWALWASLAGMWFDSKCEFAPPTILLGLLLCPWMWGISSKLHQRHAAAAPAPTIWWGFSELGRISSWPLQHHAAAAPVLSGHSVFTTLKINDK